MLRIGFDAKRAFNNNTGLGNYSRATIDVLSKYHPDNQYVLYTPKKSERFSELFQNLDNVSIRMPKSFWKTFHSFWRRYRLSGMASEEVDIFHGLSHELPVGIEKTGVKTVVTMHDLIAWRHPEYFKNIDGRTYRKKQQHACRIADIIIAISEQTRQDLLEVLDADPQKIRVVYQPCSPIFYEKSSETAKKACAEKYRLPERFILSVGTVEARKNLMTTLRALPALPDDICLVAVGRKTDYADKIIAEAEKLRLSKRLLMIDNAIFSDFPAIYSNALAFVYPSFYEGFGIPVLEAMNCDVPVVTSNVTSLPEVGGAAALYINPEDYETLGKHINSILNDNSLREKMILKGRLQAEKFFEQKIADALWGVYRELML